MTYKCQLTKLFEQSKSNNLNSRTSEELTICQAFPLIVSHEVPPGLHPTSLQVGTVSMSISSHLGLGWFALVWVGNVCELKISIKLKKVLEG
jgi:hypothetical protein